jgi:predicted nucleic acid-binding protein
MVIVDTAVWIDYLGGIVNQETVWLDHAFPRERLGLTDLIVSEVLQGVRDDAAFQCVRNDLMRLRIFATGGFDLAVAAAQNYRTSRQRALPSAKRLCSRTKRDETISTRN